MLTAFLSIVQGAENFRTPGVHLTVSRASQAAIDAIEAQQGTLVARYENRLTLVRPQKPRPHASRLARGFRNPPADSDSAPRASATSPSAP